MLNFSSDCKINCYNVKTLSSLYPAYKSNSCEVEEIDIEFYFTIFLVKVVVRFILLLFCSILFFSYESTKDGIQSVHCPTCHMLLTLTCANCNHLQASKDTMPKVKQEADVIPKVNKEANSMLHAMTVTTPRARYSRKTMKKRKKTMRPFKIKRNFNCRPSKAEKLVERPVNRMENQAVELENSDEEDFIQLTESNEMMQVSKSL